MTKPVIIYSKDGFLGGILLSVLHMKIILELLIDTILKALIKEPNVIEVKEHENLVQIDIVDLLPFYIKSNQINSF